ncbi:MULTISPECIES: hypothetical protein [Pseudomonas]|uniref:Methyltransferase n=1 Tax=Pseudomonas wuhanensis TaxID=2954098 RepID=A0ABY9GW64_9PSED|nr:MULTISPECIES: hypothetical protein [unclassified Pseudomonas]WLI13458.1 hypothetical protein PSH65_04675 [Pseudomonas sp. FP603]WLI19345.1 hypothetical protein PSH88_04675 [Pseudomonas sp. FP607]
MVTDLADVKHGGLAWMRFWAPYRALAETLEWVQEMSLKATVCDCAFDEGAPVSPVLVAGEALDPRTRITYALEVTGRNAVFPLHSAASPVPPCCALARESTSDRLLLNGGNGPLHAYVALAPLGLTPLRHAPCSLDCPATVEIVNAFIVRALALGFNDAAQAWKTLQHVQPSATLRAGLMEVKMPGLRFAYRTALHERSNRIAVTMHKPWMLSPEIDTFIHTDPSFASEFARRSRFATILWEQEAVIKRARGPIVHLGCGDGLLLDLLKIAKPNAVLHGVQSNAAPVEVGVCVQDNSAPAVHAEKWEVELKAIMASGKKPDLLLFDPIHLLALGAVERQMLVSAMHASAAAVVAYATDASLKRYGDLAELARAAGIGLVQGRRLRVSALLAAP